MRHCVYSDKVQRTSKRAFLTLLRMDMSFVPFILIVLAKAEVVKQVSSATPSRVPVHINADNDLIHKNVPKQTIAVPGAFKNSGVYSKFISSTFRIPFQDKMRAFNANGLKKEQRLSLGSLHVKKTGNYSEIITTQYRPRDGRRGQFSAPQRINGKTLKMPGEIPSVVVPTRIDTSNVQEVTRNTANSSFGTYGNSVGGHGMRASGVPATTTTTVFNPMVSKIAPSPQFKAVTSKGVDDIVVTDIIEIKKPMMFNQVLKGFGRKQQLDKLKAKHADQNHTPFGMQNTKVTNTLHGNRPRNNSLQATLGQRLPKFARGQEGHIFNQALKGQPSVVDKESRKASSGSLYKFLESIHNSKTPADLPQNAKMHVKGQAQEERTGGQLRSDHVNHKNKTTTQHDREGVAALSKQNMNVGLSGQGDYNEGNSPWLTGKSQGSRDDQEVISGYGVEDIANHFQHNNGTFGSKFSDRIDSNWMKQIGQHKEGLKMNHWGNEINDHQGNNELYEEPYGGYHDKFLLAPEQNDAPKEEQTVSSNPEENPDDDVVEYDMEGKPAEPALNQRYVPVDEFGSPFYGNETDDYFKREALAAHNRYRAIHRAPPLKLDPQLSLEAQQFAKHLANVGGAHHEIPTHLRKEGEGENVARGCSEWGGLTASGAVHRWYSQICNYDWGKRTLQPKAKNFMHVIWKGTSHMGIGRAVGTRLGFPCTFIVARYRPGEMTAFAMESNIDKGVFLPSYCNADKDDGVMSTWYPSSFPEDNRSPALDKNGEEFYNTQRFQDPSSEPAYGVTYDALNSWDLNNDEQDGQGLLNEEVDTQAINGFLPALVSYSKNQFGVGKTMVEDVGLKRHYLKPRKENINGQSVESDKHGG